ncbi:metal ABC transporter ATP-binding protein [Salisaeta longa]|uniref:metal ABC transporter ATP-binding protein n=1 Tax=Salisaeta longa TaxID=503170 RepID=UPI0003B3BEC4|nr:metal ABC transporter ATP-binding protein [Salisaeta longa]
MPDASPPPVRIADLSVRRGHQLVVRNVHFTAHAGDFVALVGPNGAGKTTILKVLLDLLPAATGTVHLWGHAPAQRPVRRIGYVPQAKTLDRTFPTRAADLLYAAAQRRWPMGGWLRTPDAEQRVTTALKRADATALADRPLTELSGGELQRVYIARALVHTPDLLLLDEPTTGVDATGAAGLYDVLEAYRHTQNATILMVTHDWNAAYHHASHVLLLDQEQIQYGPPATALSEACLRRAFGHVGHSHAMHLGASPT